MDVLDCNISVAEQIVFWCKMNDKQMEANQAIWPWEEHLNCGRHNVWNGKTNNLLTHRQEHFYAMIALYYSFHQNTLDWSNQNNNIPNHLHWKDELKYIVWIKAAW